MKFWRIARNRVENKKESLSYVHEKYLARSLDSFMRRDFTEQLINAITHVTSVK